MFVKDFKAFKLNIVFKLPNLLNPTSPPGMLWLLVLLRSTTLNSAEATSLSQNPVPYPVGFLVGNRNTHKQTLDRVIPYAVEAFNNKSSNGVKLEAVVRHYDEFSLHSLVEASCSLVTNGAVAVISPDGSYNIGTQADILGELKIPLISAVATDPHIKRASRKSLMLMSPGDEYQSNAILDLLNFYHWHEVSLVASDTNYGINGVNFFQQLLTLKSGAEFVIRSITFFNAVGHPDTMGFKNTLKNVKRSLSRVIILNCEGRYGRQVLEQANELGLLDEGHVWIVTDGITSSPQSLSFDGYYPSYYEGLIGIYPHIETKSHPYKLFKDKILSAERNLTAVSLAPHVVLTYDAVQIIGAGLEESGGNVTRQDLKCSSTAKWNSGEEFLLSLLERNYDGVTGNMTFTPDGLRKRAAYKIVNFVNPGLFVDVGQWNSEKGLEMYNDADSSSVQFLGGVTQHPVGVATELQGIHLKLGATENRPFAYKLENCTSNDISCWTGITPDIVAEFSREMNFTYEFVEPSDGEYGYLNPETDKWNGMIGDMLQGKTDMITMDLSVSFERKTHIDFSVAFMDSGISLVIKGESSKSNSFFFLSPFEVMVWLMILAGFMAMSLIQNLFNKLSPYGEYGQRVHAMQTCKCGRCANRRRVKVEQNIKLRDHRNVECMIELAADERRDEMSFYNALFLNAAGFVGHGAESMPKSPSGRLILLTWWFFVLLIICMYTATLTAFITLDRIGITIDNAKQLLQQQKYSWGMLNHSFVEALLRNNIDPDYKKIVDGAVKLANMSESIDRVKQGSFVLFDETPLISYELMGECDMFYIGGEIQTFDYAFGLPKSSPYVALFNTQIIKLREQGYFDELWKKYDRTPDDLGDCDSHTTGSSTALNLLTLKGLFYFLCFGIASSMIVFFFELIYATSKDPPDEKHRTFWAKFGRRVKLKIEDVRTEWFSQSYNQLYNVDGEMEVKCEENGTPPAYNPGNLTVL